MIEIQHNLPDLPGTWVRTELGTVITKMSNGISKRQAKDGVGTPVSRIETIATESINLKKVGYLRDVSPETVEKYRLQPNDILFSNINSDLHLGKTAIFNIPNVTLLHGMNLLLLRPNSTAVAPNYLNFLMKHYRFSGYFVSIAQHAVNQSSINQTKLRSVPVYLPPLAEQKRIVAKIEELVTRLDAGVEALKKVKAELKRYRQAVLKYAFEGKLTEQWRNAHKSEIEPASKLLERIAKEREKQAKGKKQKKLPPLDKSSLTKLPGGWEWAGIQEICDLINGRAFKPTEWSKKGLQIIRIQNLNDFNAEFNCCDFQVAKKFVVDNGQLLFAWSGTPGTSFGAHIWNRGKAVLNQHIFKVEIDERYISKSFLMHVLNHNVAEYIRKAHGTAGLAHITKGKFQSSYIGIPPFREQDKIVAEIDRHFSIADEVEQTIEKSLRQSDRLRQSILKKAFEGKLVEQNPEDEPAEKLVDRIKADRAARTK